MFALLAGLVASERMALRLYWREFVFVGLLGGFTTFSTFGLDTFLLGRTHSVGYAGLNVAAQVIGGLAALMMGMDLAHASRSARQIVQRAVRANLQVDWK